MKKIYNDDTLLKRIKKQIRIWEAYYNETGHYREETIFLDTAIQRSMILMSANVCDSKSIQKLITEKKHTKHGWRT